MITPHNKQFILSKTALSQLLFKEWSCFTFVDYQLYCHPNLQVHASNSSRVIVLGSLYDFRYPDWTKQDIVDHIASQTSLNDIIDSYSNTCGESILIVNLDGISYLMNDACAQMEVYYRKDFSLIASQPNLIQKVIELETDESPEAYNHYHSKDFEKRQTLIYNRTRYRDLFHLTPNHLLNLNLKEVKRFYPNQSLSSESIDEVAKEVVHIISGYLKSIVKNDKIVLPVTAGIDSRVILTCALNFLSKEELSNVSFFIIKLPWMNKDHEDLVVAHKIAQRLSLDLEVIDLNDQLGQDNGNIYDESLSMHDSLFNPIVDHAFTYFGKKNVTVIDGSIIGVVKNFYGNLVFVSARDLARMAGYPNSKYAKMVFSEWLKEVKEIKRRYRFHSLDMFFWEDRAGNWAAKGKSKFMLVCNHLSIFNSRKLFDTMLRTKRKDRDAQTHKIFHYILSNSDLPLQDIPINPTPRKKMILLFKKTGLYPLYRIIAIKTGILKF